jgi:spermidine/putrescine transport system permease protein
MSQQFRQNNLDFGEGRGLKLTTIVGFLFLYIPILILMLYSFNASRVASHWGGWSIKWYIEMFQDRNLWAAVTNTLIIGILNTVVSIILGTLAALGLHRFNYRFHQSLLLILNMPIIVPDIILGVSLLMFFVLLNLSLGIVSITIAHITFSISFVTLIVLSKLAQFNKTLEDAAKDLGANNWQVFWKITFPNILPGITAGGLLAFTMSIDDFIVTYFTSGVGSTTLSVYIYSMVKRGITPEINAISTLLVAITIALIFGISHIQRKPQD